MGKFQSPVSGSEGFFPIPNYYLDHSGQSTSPGTNVEILHNSVFFGNWLDKRKVM
jgi:hypothetical protein